MILSTQKNTFLEISRLSAEKHSMRSKIILLEKDITAHRNHVALLKKQMSAVCQVDLKYSPDMIQISPNMDFESVSKIFILNYSIRKNQFLKRKH